MTLKFCPLAILIYSEFETGIGDSWENFLALFWSWRYLKFQRICSNYNIPLYHLFKQRFIRGGDWLRNSNSWFQVIEFSHFRWKMDHETSNFPSDSTGWDFLVLHQRISFTESVYSSQILHWLHHAICCKNQLANLLPVWISLIYT